MKKKLVFATNNAHKLEEIRAILGDKLEILSLRRQTGDIEPERHRLSRRYS